MEGLLGHTYYGNAVLQWLTALGIVVAALIVGRGLDDLIVDMVEEPAVFVVTLAGVWLGLARLTLAPPRRSPASDAEYLVPLAEKSETDLDEPWRRRTRSPTSLEASPSSPTDRSS